MAAKRIGAALLAIALIIGAIVVRRHLDEQDHVSATSGSTSTPTDIAITVACVSDLSAICKAYSAKHPTVKIVVEPYTSTVKAVIGGTGPAAWVTIDPLPLLTNLATVTPLAESPMVAVTSKSLGSPYGSTCAAGAVTWKCIGDVASSTIRVGHLDPRTTAVGLTAMGALTRGFLGSDADATKVVIDDRDDFQSWLSNVEASVQGYVSSSTSAVNAILTRPSSARVAITTDADYIAQIGTRGSEFPLVTPTPIVRARAVVASATSTVLPSTMSAELTQLLITDGWAAVTTGPTGLPSSADVFLNLPFYGGLK